MYKGTIQVKGISLGDKPLYRIFLGNKTYYSWNNLPRTNIEPDNFNYSYGNKWELSSGRVQWNNHIFQHNEKGVLLYYNKAISGCVFKMWCGTTYGTIKVGLVPFITNKYVSSFDETDFIAGWVRRPDQKCINVINGERTGNSFSADGEQVFFLNAYMGYAHTSVGALQTTEYRSRAKMPSGYINSAFLCVIAVNDAFANSGAEDFKIWWNGTYNL